MDSVDLGGSLGEGVRLTPPRSEEGNPVAYGAKALDWLMRKGVTPTRIYEVGPRVLHALTLTLPKEIEVEKIEDFTEATGEALSA